MLEKSLMQSFHPLQILKKLSVGNTRKVHVTEEDTVTFCIPNMSAENLISSYSNKCMTIINNTEKTDEKDNNSKMMTKVEDPDQDQEGEKTIDIINLIIEEEAMIVAVTVAIVMIEMIEMIDMIVMIDMIEVIETIGMKNRIEMTDMTVTIDETDTNINIKRGIIVLIESAMIPEGWANKLLKRGEQ